MKNKKFLFTLVIGLFLISSLLIIFYPTNPRYQTSQNDTKKSSQKLYYDTTKPKASKISAPIHINNNWSDAQEAGICTGDGNYSNPYLIQDLEIDGRGLTDCIRIENSQEYFKIENCTLFNAGEWDYSNFIAGIKLNNVQNGTLENNTCHSNDVYGIFVVFCENITIYNNNLNDNTRYGLVIEESNNISISYSNFDTNLWSAIDIDNSNNTYVTNNEFINNEYGGVSLGENSQNITIMDNIFVNNELGLSESYYVDILNNTFEDCYIEFYGQYNYLKTINIDIKNKINGHPIYSYKDKVNLNYVNFTYAGEPGQVVLVNCNNSLINNLNFSNGLAGISLFDCSNNKIMGCNLTDTEEGIILYSVFNISVIKNELINSRGIVTWSCQNSTIYSNTLENTTFGIEFNGPSNYNNISDNIIRYCEETGINFDSWGDYNVIVNNTLFQNLDHGIKIKGIANSILENEFIDCGVQVEAPSEEYAGSQIIDFSNKINGKLIYYYGNKENLKPINFTYAGTPGQIILGNCSNSQIKEFQFSSSSVGVSLVFCDNITILNNSFSENSVCGISLYRSYDNLIYDNDFMNNDDYGISLSFSNFNNISMNNINYNNRDGIMLEDLCLNNTISNNIINNNGENGIILRFWCHNNTISFNTVNSNENGLNLYQFCHNNVIKYNDIKSNEAHGIRLLESNFSLILGNFLHYNGYGYWYYPYYGPYYGIIYYDGYGVYLYESFNNTVTENEFLGNKFNIIEVDCQNNKIFNNYFLTLPPTGDGDDDNGEDEDNSFLVLILLLIICSVIAVVASSSYYYHHKNKKTTGIRKQRFQESNEMIRSSPTSKEILQKLYDKSNLLPIFETKKIKKISAPLDNIHLTAVSNEFLRKLDSINVSIEEKREFLKEMMLFSPDERNEILDNILTRLNSYSEVK